MGIGKTRSERFEHAEFGQQGSPIVHVSLIFTRPMKGLSRENLQTVEVDAALSIELQVALGEIFPDDADYARWAKKAGGHRRMALNPGPD